MLSPSFKLSLPLLNELHNEIIETPLFTDISRSLQETVAFSKHFLVATLTSPRHQLPPESPTLSTQILLKKPFKLFTFEVQIRRKISQKHPTILQ
jgi:hypothetical protein